MEGAKMAIPIKAATQTVVPIMVVLITAVARPMQQITAVPIMAVPIMAVPIMAVLIMAVARPMKPIMAVAKTVVVIMPMAIVAQVSTSSTKLSSLFAYFDLLFVNSKPTVTPAIFS